MAVSILKCPYCSDSYKKIGSRYRWDSQNSVSLTTLMVIHYLDSSYLIQLNAIDATFQQIKMLTIQCRISR